MKTYVCGHRNAETDSIMSAYALADLAYDVLKVSLQPEPDGGLALTLKIAGKSTHNNVSVPVNLEVTFHGDLEQLLNTGFRTFNR